MSSSPTLSSPAFDRVIPAISLGLTPVLLGVHHWYAITYGSVYAVAVILLSTFGGLATGGTIYSPLFYSLGAHGRGLPVATKVVAGLCTVLGAAGGFYLLFVVYAH